MMGHRLRALCFGVVIALLAACSPAAGDKAEQPPAEAFRSAPDFGRVETVSIEAEGFGRTQAEAVTSAIRTAIEQVNGRSVQSEQASLSIEAEVHGLGRSLDAGGSAFADLVISRSRGAVSSFRVTESEEVRGGQWKVNIIADVARFAPPDDSRPTLVVLPARTSPASYQVGDTSVPASAAASMMQQAVAQHLASTNRFTLLDREFSSEVLSELALIESGRARATDIARLGQAQVADLIVIPEIVRLDYRRTERRLRTSDRVLVSYAGGATLRLTVVNTATGAVVMNEAFEQSWPSTEPTTLGRSVDGRRLTNEMVTSLSSEGAMRFVSTFFPITVIDWSANDLLLNQGEGALSAGERYRLVMLGAAITDPQTGADLGRRETEIGVAIVVSVQRGAARARLESGPGIGSTAFRPGLVELRERLAPPEPSVASPVASPPQTTTAPSNTEASSPPDAVNNSDW
jgi:hypothetical protein